MLIQLGMMPRAHLNLPVGVNRAVYQEIESGRRQLEAFHQEHAKEVREGRSGGDGDSEEEEGVSTEERPDALVMGVKEWEAIEAAVRNRIARDRRRAKEQLERPAAHSARIAWYNPKTHFGFRSEEAASSVDRRHAALVQCQLQSRPSSWLTGKDHTRRPFELGAPGLPHHFDVEGDLVAACGDLAWNEMRDERGFVAFGAVPVPVNAEEAASLAYLKDAAGHRAIPDDGPALKCCFKSTHNRRANIDFVSCRADSKNALIWAASTSGNIHAFSTAHDLRRPERLEALLTFGEVDKKIQAKLSSSFVGREEYEFACCGESIVGSGGSGHLSIWNIAQAREEFPGPESVGPFLDQQESNSFCNSDSEEEDEKKEEEKEMEPPSPKKKRASKYSGCKPKLACVEEKGFACGGIEHLARAHFLVAPYHTGTMRLYDLESEQVLGLFCGAQNRQITKQYCYHSNSLIFCMDENTGLGWDTRTFKPVFALHTDQPHNGLLGVPSNSPVAFTYGGGSECISCWDLRMPSSHAYTMSTGNTDVLSLHWHGSSTSIVASTKSSHVIEHGRYAGYMYEERLTEEEEEAARSYDWYPPGARHEAGYFGPEKWHVGSEHYPQILVYPFGNGRNIDASL